jgi:hypothetical protein
MVSTRSGRTIKKPVFYEPEEVVEDDFSDSEYDSDDTGGSDCESIRTDEDGEEDNGSDLEDFIVGDEEECVLECDEDDEDDYSGSETDSEEEPVLDDDDD